MSDTSLIALGRAVRELREERNVSEGDLATAVGTTLATLRALEADRLDPD